MCGGCSSDNNQMNMTFQVLGAGMISLSVAAGAVHFPCVIDNLDGSGSGRRRWRWRWRQRQ
jgi:hypothetical protein